MQWDLRVTARSDGDVYRLAVSGRLSAATASRLAEALATAIAAGHTGILLDLKELDYISSGGILTLEAAAARLRAEGGWLRLAETQPAVRVALDLAGWDQPEDGA